MRLLALCLTLLMLTACTGRKAEPAEPVTVNLFVDPEDRTFDLAIEAFERMREDIRIHKVTYSLGGTRPPDQIRAEKLRNHEVDLLRVSLDQAQLAAENLILPLDPFIQKAHLDLAPYGGLIDGLRVDGKLYVLPIYATPSVIWYNASLFEAADVPAPTPGWTWEEFRQAAAKLTRGDGEARVWGVYDPFSLEQIAQTMVWQQAAHAPVDPGAAKEILSFWATMVDTDQSVLPMVPRQSGITVNTFAKAEGRVAMTSGSVSEYEGIYPPVAPPRPTGIPEPHWEAAPLPVFPGGQPALSAFPQSLAIARESPHVDAAWEFLRFLASEEGSVAIVRAGRFPVLRTPAVRDAWFERHPAPPRSTEFLFETDFMAQSFVPGDATFLINGTFREALGKVLQGGADWEGLYKEFLVKREAILKGRSGASAPPPAPGAVEERTPDPAEQVSVPVTNHAALAAYFAAAPAALPGIFVVEGEELFYDRAGERMHILTGARPRALAVGSEGVLVSDGAKLFWFDPASGTVTEIPGAPPVHRAVVHGDTYLMVGEKKVFRWRPGGEFVALPAPEHLFAVYGVSISPDGRYGVVAYDLDIPQGPRAGVIWAFDLEDGTVLQWPTEQPKVMYGLWLLGWSDEHTVRFMAGQRGFNRGHTWDLPDGDPSAPDGTEYRMMENAWSNAGGSWFVYRTSTEEVVVQSAAPGSEAILVCNAPYGVDDPRVLLNGSLAFRTRSPGVWWEVTRGGEVLRWDGATELY